MAINFTDSPSNGDTQTINGRTYTYNSAKNKWDTTATEVVGPTATTYATVNDLPTSGVLTGAQAFVTATNRLYIWNGTGWYNIALINTAPTISGASSAYTLAIDGTATTVTLTATDPEGLPITYSIASDTSGNIATVTQNSNVFTITPSTNTANYGSFSLTFRASDGVNLATAVSSFTLQFTVTNQKYTSALITTAGNAGVNNSFTDSSGNSHTVTSSGTGNDTPTQNSFSPYRHGGYSTYFDGTGDYLSATHHSSFDLGSDDFTIETWMYLTGYSNSYGGYYASGICGKDNNTTRSYTFSVSGTSNSHTGLYFNMFTGGSPNTTQSTTSFNLHQWYHVAVSRESGTLKLFVDGVVVQTNTSANQTPTAGAQPFVVGAGSSYSGYEYRFPGYLADFRFVKGTAVYIAAFTPPTERLTAITNTSLLTCHLPYIADGSTIGHTLTRYGDTKTQPVAPYDTQEYTAGSHGGSVYLDGTGDRLTVASTTDLGFGTGDFTIEYWIKHKSKLSGSNYPYAFDMRSQDNEAKLALYHRTNVNNIVGIYVSQNTIVSGTNQMYDGMDWVHYAICKTGGYLKGYFNGKEDFSVADSTDYGSSGQISIGSTYSNLYHMDGHIADFRVVKGTAVYTGQFTPPTAPLTAITNTSLLLSMQGAKIFDKAQGSASNLLIRGNAAASTAAYKYLPTSMYFDGTGDLIVLEHMSETFDGDFTVEMWVKFNTYSTSGANSRLFASRFGNANAANNLQLIIGYGSSTDDGRIDVWTNTYHINDSTVNIADNNWHHVALTRQGTSMKLFIDGTQDGGTATTSQVFNFENPRLGARDDTTDAVSKYTGYMSDVRITKGLARYTANFTPPSSALNG